MENIKQLREKTGAGIVDCKKAIAEANNDIDKAVEILRKQGIAKAAKRTDREAREGVIKLAVNDESNSGYIVEINAETDFVVRSSRFKEFADKIMNIIKSEAPESREELLGLPMDNGNAQEALDSLSGVIGEKLDIKRCSVLKGSGTVAAYSHMDGKIGVLVLLDKPGQAELAKDIAMQVAAANPKYITPDDVPSGEIEKEKEIYQEQLKKEGKPEKIIDKIIEGKIRKYFAEVCLVEQEYIKEDKKKVKEILGDIKVEQFIRYSL